MHPVRLLLPNYNDKPSETLGGTDTAGLVVSNNNRWSRVTFSFEDVEPDTWCELSFRLEWHLEEECRNAHDFGLVGVDFLAEDGSSIDFAYVPGLTRGLIDPHSWPINGPDYYSNNEARCRVSLGFFIPSPTRKLAISIRSWRNSHPFVVHAPKVLQGTSLKDGGPAIGGDDEGTRAVGDFRLLNARRTWIPLKTDPSWMRFSVLPGRKLLIRGQIVNESLGPEGALARIVYRNLKGEELPPPYPETVEAPEIGCFVSIPVHRQARRFTLDLMPPPEAVAVELGFQTWADQTSMELVVPLEISLEDDLMLEAISGDELPDAVTYLKQFLSLLGLDQSTSELLPGSATSAKLLDLKALASPLSFQDKLRGVQRGNKPIFTEGSLILGTAPAWPLPDHVQWTENPFQSPAWRLEFQSLSWLVDLVRQEDTQSLKQAIDLAASWSNANPWGSSTDPISAHPRALTARAETFLRLLSLSANSRSLARSPEFLTLFAEAVRHASALAQLLCQNVFSHSVVHLHAACALLALARGLPRIPLAPYWDSVALTHISGGFDRFFDEDGTFLEHSFDIKLETISLGLILVRQLDGSPDIQELRTRLTERFQKALRNLVAMTEPSGSLPSFGDSPYRIHHASWLRRLLSGYGANLLSDPELATELSYPSGKKVFASQSGGLLAARRYDRSSNWSYFGSSLNGGLHEHGHFDCTSFVYSSGGAPWIVDPKGSNLHEAGAARQYLVSSRAHNLALPDGRNQLAGVGWIETHEELEEASVFVVASNVHGPEYGHRRIFVAPDNLDALAVFDQFVSYGKPITFEGFLHFDTDIIVALASTQTGVAYRSSDKLRIAPYVLNGQFNGMGVENGRNDRLSTIQGFLARPTGGLQPANVLSYRISGHENVCGGVLLSANDKAADLLLNSLRSAGFRNILKSLSPALPAPSA